MVRERPASLVLALVEGLPPSSRFYAHVAGGDEWRAHWGWDKDRHMLADYIDTYVAAHTAQNKKPWTYPRPGTKQSPQGGIPLLAMVGKNFGGVDDG